MTQVARTSVDPTVIAGIAAIAATQVPGVRLHVRDDGLPPTAPAAPARRPGLAGSLSLAADPEPPVRSWCEEPGSVSVAVVVEVALSGAGSRPIPIVADDVRREVAAAMTAMTRLRVARCDVHVADVYEPATPAPPAAPAPRTETHPTVELHSSVELVETPGRLAAARPPYLRELTALATATATEALPDAPALVPPVLQAVPEAPEAPLVPRPRVGDAPAPSHHG